MFYTSSCARHACFATCRHRRIWHVAAVHLCNVCMHSPLRSIQIMDCPNGRSWKQHGVCGHDPSIQQSSHTAVSVTLYYTHNFPDFHLAFYTYAFISTTSTVTILCTCSIMHDKLITYCCSALLTAYKAYCLIQWESPYACASLVGTKVTMT